VVSLGKVCEGWLHLRLERSKIVDRGKWLKETHFGVGIVSNSRFLNGDVGITELGIVNFGKQIIVPPLLVYLPVYFLVQLCFPAISYDVLYCLVDIVYIYL
jgi:hypothetical protein